MTENLGAWHALLDQFERAADAAEAQMATETFEPPPGPLPAELVERAQEVLAAQQRTIADLAAAQAAAVREIAALRRVPSVHTSMPAYLDVEG
ncbi:hypothetical protein QWJ90_01825 [Microbacterium oryzae]|uniref:hypothetical protein n=1 Tax=Microbacterium oryzae TaxID=743009 RepID=UPI0025B23AA2|nr:hypothetical protein [Microbacterium oryzae]MDN3309662.1 hypothetical protein [Microbacterium oryzae]